MDAGRSANFGGFPAETQRFLDELRANNTREWFESHREDYQRFYLEPARQFVEAAGAILRQVAPGIQAEPRILGSIFRINRDTRFSQDKRPYKDHLDLWFWEGQRKQAVSGFVARISPDLVAIGAGCHGFDRDQLAAYRRGVDHPAAGRLLRDLVAQLTANGYQPGGAAAVRSRPLASPKDDPDDLRRHGALFVHLDAPADLARTRDLLEECRRHWHRLAPLHRWLVEQVQLPLTTLRA